MNSFLKITNCLILILLLSSCKNEKYVKISKDSKEAFAEATFVGSNSCVECHEEEFLLWKDSHHDQAMKIADSTSILADFNNTTFIHKGIKNRFYKNGNDYFVNTEGPNGEYTNYKIEYTFGFTPLQQYIVEFPNGAYQCLLTAWDTVEKKWFHLQPNLDIQHTEWMHWTGGSMTWNSMCADCHSTNLQKKYDASTENYTTTFSEINAGCESCHGPSSTHVEYYQNKENYIDKTPPKLYMDLAMSSRELIQKCARCHSRRGQSTAFFDYKGHFLDHYNPSLLISPFYELDGQIKDEDYVYGSFMQSKMYHYGVSCKDCHDVHSLKLKKNGNALCMQCHESHYNEYSHHFHKQNTDASQCINCHMTGKYYMGNDFRRDHSFRIPRPDQTAKYDTPNACNTCHKDKSAQWASDFIIEKYGKKRLEHFSDDLLAGYGGNTAAFYKVFSQHKYPEIIRATAIHQYGNQLSSQEDINKLLTFVRDPSALVRNETILALGKIEHSDFSEHLKPLLLDSIRLVRISAARYFNMRNIPIDDTSEYFKAQKEYLEALYVNADFATGQHQIALHNQAKGKLNETVKAYNKALEIDNFYNLSRLNLALLEYNKGDTKTAEKLYLKVVTQEPEYSYPYFMLGLLYNEKGDSESSLHYLKLATQKQPVIERAFYNYALKLHGMGQYDSSIDVVNKALEKNILNEELLYVKLLNELNSNKNKEAIDTCKRLLLMAPENVNYQNILKKLRSN